MPCSDIIVDANGHRVTCAFKGDLPLLAQDSQGKEFHIVLRGVRYSPSFEDTLVSVDQLWYSSHIDTRFRDLRHLHCTKSKSNGLDAHAPVWPAPWALHVGCGRSANQAANNAAGATCRHWSHTLPWARAKERHPCSRVPTPMCAPCPQTTSPQFSTAACTWAWDCSSASGDARQTRRATSRVHRRSPAPTACPRTGTGWHTLHRSTTPVTPVDWCTPTSRAPSSAPG